MIFLGGAFASGLNSLDATPSGVNDANVIKINNAKFDELYATSQALNFSTTIPTDWDLNTILHANFTGNLLAGNVNFYVGQVSKLRIKRRKKGDSKWVVLYEQPITTGKDFNVEWYDRTARSNTIYEYTVVPVFDKVEGYLVSQEITTDFNGLIILDKNSIFSTELDVVVSEKRNKPRAVISTINRKHPFVVSNGSNNFDSGTASAQWLEYDSSDDSWDVDRAREYLSELKDFLNNGSAKLLKLDDGRMWLIDLSSSEISDSEDNRKLQVHTSFEWVEIGDCDENQSLYDNNLIDCRGD